MAILVTDGITTVTFLLSQGRTRSWLCCCFAGGAEFVKPFGDLGAQQKQFTSYTLEMTAQNDPFCSSELGHVWTEQSRIIFDLEYWIIF